MFRYVPYSTLTPAARVKAERGDKDFTFNASGRITAKSLDRCTERSISMIDWHAASKTAVDHTRFHWGDTRAEALATHNTLVMELTHPHNWEIAMDYDIQQREAVLQNPVHDLASLDTSTLTIISTRLALKPSPHTYAPQHTTSHPLPLPKHPASTDPSQPSSCKHSRPEQALCFQCRLTGHLPADCKAKRTTAGKPIATAVRGSRGEHSLVTSSGKQYCFSWACTGICKFGSNCYNVHSCSLCGDSTHGAAACKSTH
ncbi:hypothetical protein K439DRAFT_1617504 [Ramaria rubella]|nr:hypothetical protein K439DRAFT_1617504 [Ramaria rubella]